ncbi:glandular kallikrein [Drosophila teissieri]|uniref:glandular kallikrein n=1 Tax=Drosophila teissieri TaxID=7243 RepID=UPI001CBA2349|nr:glandular kallikrein [Drosophila teissieri]
MLAIHSGFFAIKIMLLWRGVTSQFLESDCGYPGITPKIMNGQNAEVRNNPWMAYIFKYNNEGVAELVCGGTLIHKEFVLTAAHCIARDHILAVRLGEHSTSRYYAVTKAFRNKNFTITDYSHDIGILRIQPEVQFNAFIRPVCIITDPTKVPNVKTFRAAGWGRTENETFSRALKTVELNELNASECYNIFGMNLTESQICAGHPNGDTCVGDSGGPLIHPVYMDGSLRYVQLGITSFGRSDCRSGGVYTRLSCFIDWILMVVNTYTVRSPPMIQFRRGSFGK